MYAGIIIFVAPHHILNISWKLIFRIEGPHPGMKASNRLITGDSILNTASIYFDFNLPSKTNTEKTLISDGSTILCPGGSTSLTSKITGTTYQWQVDVGTVYTNIGQAHSARPGKSLLIGVAALCRMPIQILL